MVALDQEQDDLQKYLRCEQADKIKVKKVMKRVKKQIRTRLEQYWLG